MRFSTMDGRHRLAYVQRKRARRENVHLAGDAMARFAADLSAGSAIPDEVVLQALADTVDAEFKRHCRVVGLRGQELVINVDEVSRVYPMRMRWSGPLWRLLTSGFRRPLVSRLRFQFGSAGTCVGGAAEAT